MSQFAYGGFVAQLGFAALASAWLCTGTRAYLAIRRGDIVEHRKWMVRTFSHTFAEVKFRLFLPIFLASGVEYNSGEPVKKHVRFFIKRTVISCYRKRG